MTEVFEEVTSRSISKTLQPSQGWGLPAFRGETPSRLSAVLGTHDAYAPPLETLGSGKNWIAALTLNAAFAVFIGALAANGSRHNSAWSIPLFYFCIACSFLPIVMQTIQENLSRSERLRCVLLAAAALFLFRVLREPASFIDHDEFLHWTTALDIGQFHTLYGPNALLPVGPYFPGLELVTNALSSLSSLSIFPVALLFLGLMRIVFVAALFFLFEKITRSSLIAAAGCLFYMGNSTFVFFDAHFSYESLSVVILVVILLVEALVEIRDNSKPLILMLPLIAALSVTHHLTSYFAAALLCSFFVLDRFRSPNEKISFVFVTTLCSAIAFPIIWSEMMGNPSSGYLGPVLINGLNEVAHLATHSTARELFVSDDGSTAPLWQRYIAIASVLVICIGLATGFLRSLVMTGALRVAPHISRVRFTRNWTNTRLLALTLLTLLYPLSILFRFTSSGWEIGNRVGPFSFFGVAIVVAISAVAFLATGKHRITRQLLLSVAATVVLIGGIISSEGPRILVPQHFQVSADSASIEPMGVAAADWSRQWLGPENLFATDRINRLLLATYGRQQIATSLQDGIDLGTALLSPSLDSRNTQLFRRAGVDYAMADLRMTKALPVVGVYFDGAASDHNYAAPPTSTALLKLDNSRVVSRVFDDGYHVIFDVRALSGKH